MHAEQLEATLDLWASMWEPDQRASFEEALARLVLGQHPRATRLNAIAACHAIGTPHLLWTAARAGKSGEFAETEMAEVAAVTAPIFRLLKQAEHLTNDPASVAFFVRKVVHDPHHRIADPLLDRVDVRDLWSVLQSGDDSIRHEAARRIARRGPRQRRALAASLSLTLDALDARLRELAIDEAALQFGASISDFGENLDGVSEQQPYEDYHILY